MKDIKLILKEELGKERENYVIESFKPLYDANNQSIFLETYINIGTKLLDEGYDIDEIEMIVEQNMLDNILQGAKGMWDKTDVTKILKGGGWSMVKEQLIRWVLSAFGVSGGALTFLSAALADYDPRMLLKMFKNKEMCITNAGPLSNSLMEGLIRYVQIGGDKDISVAQLGIGNIIGEVIQESNIGNVVAQKFCNLIWK
jgi:hypothetical protein